MIRKYMSGAMASAALALGLISSPASANVGDFIGNWVTTNPGTTGIVQIVVTPSGGNVVTVHVFGQCQPLCDWGTTVGHSYTDGPGSNDVRTITASFNAGFARKLVILRHTPNGDMRYEDLTTFTDGSGRNDYDITGVLSQNSGGPGWGGPGGWPPGGGPGGPGGWPPGGGPGGPGGGPQLGQEDCIGFNPMMVTAAYVGGAWKVVQGSMWMLDYGSNKSAAVDAANTIHHYNFDQQCFVRRPNAAMMYWKSGGHVPGGNLPGQDCIGLNPMHVSVGNFGGSWKVVDGQNWLLDFGSDKAAADQASAVIHTYNMNRQCFIVRPNASMQYWLAQ